MTICRTTSSQVRIVSSLMRTMRSPGASDASARAPAGSRAVTRESTWVVFSSGVPTLPASAAKMTNASSAFIATPAHTTISRTATGFLSKARAGSIGSALAPPSSSPAMPSSSSPAIFT